MRPAVAGRGCSRRVAAAACSAAAQHAGHDPAPRPAGGDLPAADPPLPRRDPGRRPRQRSGPLAAGERRRLAGPDRRPAAGPLDQQPAGPGQPARAAARGPRPAGAAGPGRLLGPEPRLLRAKQGAPTPAAYQGWIDSLDRQARLRPEPSIMLEPDAVAADCFDTGARPGCWRRPSAARRRRPVRLPRRRARRAGSRPARPPSGCSRRHRRRRGLRRQRVQPADHRRQHRLGPGAVRPGRGPAVRGRHVPQRDRPATGRAGPGRRVVQPAHQALGSPATTRTGMRGVDALLWIKRPGESDGKCGGEATYFFSPTRLAADGQQPVRAGRGPTAGHGHRRFPTTDGHTRRSGRSGTQPATLAWPSARHRGIARARRPPARHFAPVTWASTLSRLLVRIWHVPGLIAWRRAAFPPRP